MYSCVSSGMSSSKQPSRHSYKMVAIPAKPKARKTFVFALLWETRDLVTHLDGCAMKKRSHGYYFNHISTCRSTFTIQFLSAFFTKKLKHHQPSMAYLKNRSFTLKMVFLSECWQRRSSILFTRSSTTLLTSSEKTATSRGRMMSCLSTLRILCQSSFSLGNSKKTKRENDRRQALTKTTKKRPVCTHVLESAFLN